MSSYLDVAHACDRWLKKRFPDRQPFKFCLGKKREIIEPTFPARTKDEIRQLQSRIAKDYHARLSAEERAERVAWMKAGRDAKGPKPKLPADVIRKKKRIANKKWYQKVSPEKKADMAARRRATWAALPIEKRREIKAKKMEAKRRKREREKSTQEV
jgi:hypothetical protein